MAISPPPTLADLVDGQKVLIYDIPGHHEWEGLGCEFHRGRFKISAEGNPDAYAPDTGLQVDCPSCIRTTQNTLDYMQQKYLQALSV